MVLFGPISAVLFSYRGRYVKYTGPGTRIQSHKNEVILIQKGAFGICSAVIGPKMTIAFKEDCGKRMPVNSRVGLKADWKHQADIYPFDEPNSWDIELDL